MRIEPHGNPFVFYSTNVTFPAKPPPLYCIPLVEIIGCQEIIISCLSDGFIVVIIYPEYSLAESQTVLYIWQLVWVIYMLYIYYSMQKDPREDRDAAEARLNATL